ncbi:sensor histidine kinase NtrY-like [Prosthecodimorpha hirschii]|uniref:sensor histidine kinase NtrY-like n=1 Tax=Prosthecodimorpha hirschii TaxID=665126 RepID=UPI001AED9C78|nr:PAS domain-containing sensor histidine kinase [Prosthecomicrobium hirschii]
MTDSTAEPILTLPKHVAAPIGEYGKFVRMIGLILVILSLLSVLVSFAILTGITPITPSDQVLKIAMVVNAVLLLALTGLIGWELVGLYIAWKDGRAAARLHWRILTHFSVIAAAPAVIIAVLASVTLDQGLDRWFETRTRTIVQNAAQVGAAYLQEHARVLRGDAIAMAAEIDQAKPLYDDEPTRFDQFFENQCSLRQIPAAFILRADGTVVTSAKLDEAWDSPLMPPPEAFRQAENDEPVVIAPGQSNQVGAVMKLKEFEGLYLYATRPLDGRVLDQVRLAQAAAGDYGKLESSRYGVQLAFALIFVGVALILLLAAIWAGIGFANRLVAPIRRLILAADYVSKGNLAIQVPVRPKEGDLAHLGETFNTMTAELRTQRSELIAAKDQIDRRRRFTEAMLAGVTAGVIGLDAERRITLANRSALALLDTAEANLLGKSVDEAVPELAAATAEMSAEPSHRARQTQVTLRRAGQERTINVRFTTETTAAGGGLVVTLDDITDLVTAQRSSAWADVARRIAHEIKNPLTPIQLSAERIRRRYAKRIEDDRQVFDQCVDTIIRQVGDIERMVNEFSSFARMPKPQKEAGDLREPLREAVFLQSVGNPEIDFVSRLPDTPLAGKFDMRLMNQVFTNLVKNATEAIAAVDRSAPGSAKGCVEVAARVADGEIVIDVIDNGIGFPQENRHRLLEPYVTTREKGTGLGLAIVRKILEEHGGRIELLDAPAVATGGQGAMMRLILPAAEAGAQGVSVEAGREGAGAARSASAPIA